MKAPSTLRALGLACALAFACGEEPAAPLATTRQDVTQGFAAGSLVIPMDTDYQNQGTLSAFGLLDALLRARVPVSLVAATGKALGGVDFTAAGTDLRSGAAVPSHGYRGGPFVIDAADRAAALPVIRGWQSSIAGQKTAVHDLSTPFSAEVRRKLTAAPHIGIFLDGFEWIAFSYLNAAGIPDSLGQPWPNVTATQASYTGYPDILTPAAIKGGALQSADGTPAFCAVSAMHYPASGAVAEDAVVAAVRTYLTGAGTAAQFECEAAKTFEDSASGSFLTTGGIQDDGGGVPNPNTFLFPDNPYAQIDGSFSAVGGMLQSIGLLPGSAFKGNGVKLVQADSAFGTDGGLAYLTGYLDGVTTNGKVSYLAGHRYLPTLPISTNPQTNGIRLYLDATYQSSCTAAEGQPNPSLTMSATPFTSGSSLTFTVSYSNPGPGTAGAAVLTDTLPAGLTFVSGSPGAVVSGQTVTWNLGNLKPGASGTLTLTASVSADGTYINQASLAFLVSLTPRTVTGSATSSVRDTTPPRTSITSAPFAITSTADATFSFISSKPGSTFQCSLDGGAPVACTSPVTYPALGAGPHTFKVTATDSAGVADPNPATYGWTVQPLTGGFGADGGAGADGGGGGSGAGGPGAGGANQSLALAGGGCASAGVAGLPALLALLAFAAPRRRKRSALDG